MEALLRGPDDGSWLDRPKRTHRDTGSVSKVVAAAMAWKESVKGAVATTSALCKSAYKVNDAVWKSKAQSICKNSARRVQELVMECTGEAFRARMQAQALGSLHWERASAVVQEEMARLHSWSGTLGAVERFLHEQEEDTSRPRRFRAFVPKQAFTVVRLSPSLSERDPREAMDAISDTKRSLLRWSPQVCAKRQVLCETAEAALQKALVANPTWVSRDSAVDLQLCGCALSWGREPVVRAGYRELSDGGLAGSHLLEAVQGDPGAAITSEGMVSREDSVPSLPAAVSLVSVDGARQVGRDLFQQTGLSLRSNRVFVCLEENLDRPRDWPALESSPAPPAEGLVAAASAVSNYIRSVYSRLPEWNPPKSPIPEVCLARVATTLDLHLRPVARGASVKGADFAGEWPAIVRTDHVNAAEQVLHFSPASVFHLLESDAFSRALEPEWKDHPLAALFPPKVAMAAASWFNVAESVDRARVPRFWVQVLHGKEAAMAPLSPLAELLVLASNLSTGRKANLPQLIPDPVAVRSRHDRWFVLSIADAAAAQAVSDAERAAEDLTAAPELEVSAPHQYGHKSWRLPEKTTTVDVRGVLYPRHGDGRSLERFVGVDTEIGPDPAFVIHANPSWPRPPGYKSDSAPAVASKASPAVSTFLAGVKLATCPPVNAERRSILQGLGYKPQGLLCLVRVTRMADSPQLLERDGAPSALEVRERVRLWRRGMGYPWPHPPGLSRITGSVVAGGLCEWRGCFAPRHPHGPVSRAIARVLTGGATEHDEKENSHWLDPKELEAQQVAFEGQPAAAAAATGLCEACASIRDLVYGEALRRSNEKEIAELMRFLPKGIVRADLSDTPVGGCTSLARALVEGIAPPRAPFETSWLLHELQTGKLVGTLEGFYRRTSSSVTSRDASVRLARAAGVLMSRIREALSTHAPRSNQGQDLLTAKELVVHCGCNLVNMELQEARRVLETERAVRDLLRDIARHLPGMHPLEALKQVRDKFDELNTRRTLVRSEAEAKRPVRVVVEKVLHQLQRQRLISGNKTDQVHLLEVVREVISSDGQLMDMATRVAESALELEFSQFKLVVFKAFFKSHSAVVADAAPVAGEFQDE
jgi:hypothetical protein